MQDHPQRNPMWRDLLIQAILLVALLVAVFPGAFLRGHMISPADILFQVLPWRAYAPEGLGGMENATMSDVIIAFRPYYVLTKRALANGEWPLWNHLESAGLPLLANCQSAVFYPPRLLHAFLDVDLATSLYIILKLWLCGMTAYVCGRGMKLSVPVARFLSVAWMLSSYNLIWCNWPLPDVSAWIPVLFLGVESVLRAAYTRGFFCMLLGATLILLAGHPETAFSMCLGLGIYFALRLVWERRWGRALWIPIGVCAGAWGLALLVCAAQLIPFAEYLVNSSTFFTRRYDESRHLPLKPSVTAAFWLPRFFGASRDGNFWGDINSNVYSMVYPGIAVWVGVSLLFTRLPHERLKAARSCNAPTLFRTSDPRIICLALAAASAILLAFDTPAVRSVNRLPLLRSMYFHYHVGFPVFALPLLAAIGFERWTASHRKLRELLWCIPVLLAMSLNVAFIYGLCSSLIHALHIEAYIALQMLIAAALVAACLAILAAHCLRPSPKAIVSLLTLVLACDLLFANRSLNPTLPKEQISPETELTTYLQSLGQPCRIGMAEGDIPAGPMVAYGLEDWGGYDGLYPARMGRFTRGHGPGVWGNIEPLRSIQYFASSPDFENQIPARKMQELERVAKKDDVTVYRNPKAVPRAFLVGQVQVIPDFPKMLDVMRSDDYDPRRVALIESPLSGELSDNGSDNLGAAEVVEWTSTKVTVRAEAHQGSVLVLADAYYPGWSATIDGERAEIFPVYHIYRGVLLGPGQHTVEYTYAPWSFRLGMGISVISLVASALVAAFLLHRRGHTAYLRRRGS